MLSDNTTQIGLINVSLKAGKVEFNIFGKAGSIGQKKLGAILMVIELVIAGISVQYITWNMTDSWIVAGALIITVIIFGGGSEIKKVLEE